MHFPFLQAFSLVSLISLCHNISQRGEVKLESMQNIANKVRKNFQDLEKFLKLKFGKKRSVPHHILFQELFRCEGTARILAHSFFKETLTKPNKFAVANRIATQTAIPLFLIVEIISFGLSIQQNLINIMFENVVFCGSYFILTIKIYSVFQRDRVKIHEIIEKLDEHFPHYGVDQLIFKAQNYLDTLKLVETIYYIIYIFAGIQISLMPFLHQIYGAAKSDTIEWETLFALTLPFDQLQPIVYESIWIIESWLFLFTFVYLICGDMLFYSLIQILALEFNILGQVISEIDMSEGEEAAIKELKKLIVIHDQLIQVSKKLNEMSCGLQFVNVFGSIIALCTASFLLVSGISGYFIAKYFMFPFGLIVQIYSQCYFSQLLIDSSTSIATSAYNTEWYASSEKFRRYILQIMVRAQRAQTIKAWKFFDMSLEIFQWIVTTSYSYYSVLQGTYGA